jgi:hypothetical protein
VLRLPGRADGGLAWLGLPKLGLRTGHRPCQARGNPWKTLVFLHWFFAMVSFLWFLCLCAGLVFFQLCMYSLALPAAKSRIVFSHRSPLRRID